VAPGEVDVERFGELADRGRDALAAGRPGEAATVLREALGMWRGPPLAEFAYERFAEGETGRLDELRVGAVEELIEAKLAVGRHAGPGRR
jgi:DNA-binding SARP family transcriptional activator